MANYAEYFEAKGYKPKYSIGDRVYGKWNNIPFMGTVGNDRLLNEIDGPEITIHLDLPIKHENKIHGIIVAKHKYVKRMVSYDK
jgi:hypothetical protein